LRIRIVVGSWYRPRPRAVRAVAQGDNIWKVAFALPLIENYRFSAAGVGIPTITADFVINPALNAHEKCTYPVDNAIQVQCAVYSRYFYGRVSDRCTAASRLPDLYSYTIIIIIIIIILQQRTRYDGGGGVIVNGRLLFIIYL
jgi:hypothetical protein